MDKALNSLGRPITQTAIWQLSDEGANMGPDNYDIDKFAIVLTEFFGEGSESLLKVIYKNMCRRLKINPQSDQSLTALEKIKQILESERR
ncbi:MAG TPA: hypothetical protein VF172_00235 [Nitrososphaera sp.]